MNINEDIVSLFQDLLHDYSLQGAPVKQKLFSNAMFSQAKALTVGAVQHLHS